MNPGNATAAPEKDMSACTSILPQSVADWQHWNEDGGQMGRCLQAAAPPALVNGLRPDQGPA
jgi:hypothetical protein